MFIASLLLAFSTILLCNATIDTQIISRVDNTQEILSVIFGDCYCSALLTAGIAIKNIMYISILQRTRNLHSWGLWERPTDGQAVIHNERKQLSWVYFRRFAIGFFFLIVYYPWNYIWCPVWPAHCFPVLLYGSLFFGHSVHRQNWLRLYPLWRHWGQRK